MMITAAKSEASSTPAKTAVVTGGTSGIGLQTALGLAAQGFEVVVTGRDRDRGAAAAGAISAAGNRTATFVPIDHSSQADIRRGAGALRQRLEQLDVLVNNVGGLYAQRWETVDGIEATWAMSHLASVVLTEELLPLLIDSAPARIVNVSSTAIRYAGKQAPVEPTHETGRYVGLVVYGQAKLANLVWTFDLSRRLASRGVQVFAADPGGAKTDMTDKVTPAMMPQPMKALFPLFRRFGGFKAPEQAARSTLHAATSVDLNDRTGLLITASSKVAKTPAQAIDPARVQTTVAATQRLIGAGLESPGV